MTYGGQGGYSGPPHSGTGGWGAFPPPPSSPPPPPPYPAGFGRQPQQPPSQTSMILALVCNILAITTCYGVIPAIVGLVLSIIALSQAQTDPVGARKLTIGAWICFGVAAAFFLFLVLVYGAWFIAVLSSTPY
ncbi:hypothetical protein NI17_006330 [Thermobifida halotolerans]|uniref:Uncharacterized protein n=1 Tax=Thermobifida halotolerans TaxID=483545 RepID=A0A399G7F5_9ACTN|nr:hypothetical protein [Thermobifida halotolerans]UOE20802.1 hypothetical protein NI17_006330 [Thermobifida halotolerans]